MTSAELSADPAQGAAAPTAAVLIVNDRAAERLAIRTMLKPLHLAVVEAESGQAALRAVLRQPFAVIVMDVRMPTMDGYETAKLIRQRGSSVTPIIFATAFGRDETETATAYASGAVDFIFTPIQPDVLRAKISAFVDLFEQAQKLESSLRAITELNAKLSDSEQRQRVILENVVDGVVTADPSGRIESLNYSAERLFAYAEEDIIGQPLEHLVAPEHQAALTDALHANRSATDAHHAHAVTTETQGRRRDGSSFPMEADLSQVRIGDRAFTICCVRDASTRAARVEEERARGRALRSEAQRYRVAFEEAPIGSMIADRKGRIERVSRAFCNMTGYTADELVGRAASHLTHPDDRVETSEGAAALLRGDARTYRAEQRWLHRTGRVLEVRLAVTAIRDDAEKVTQFFAQIEDVTDARRTSRELEAAQFEMLARLAGAAEFHDDETGEHTRRVGEISVTIAERLGLPQEQIDLIRLAAPLHDIGKIAMPDSVLGKRGKLTAEEFEQMKTHTTIGAKMLTGSSYELLVMAEQIALTHHERWDGSGYPAGLAGEAIPIEGRIVAVADVFDALTHTRPYKLAWRVADAVDEMLAESGVHFDPAVLDAFLRHPG